MSEQIFPIVPSTSNPLWMLVPLLAILLLVGGIMGWAVYSSRHVRFAVSGTGIRVEGDIYGRAIPASHLLLAEARAVNLKQDSELRPTARTNGTSIPGYSAGWMRLGNGAKGLVFLTDRTRVVYIPTTEGYSLLLSVADPDAFLAQARQTVAH